MKEPVSEVFVSFEFCLMIRYGRREYSVSVLEFLRSLSVDDLKGRGCGSDMDGARKFVVDLVRVDGSADCCLPINNCIRSVPNVGLWLVPGVIGDLDGVAGNSTAVSRRSWRRVNGSYGKMKVCLNFV